MNLIDLKCKNCGANLKLNPEKLQAFCQYCGNELLIDMNTLSEVLKEKEKTKQVIEKEKEKTKQIIEKEQYITQRKKMDYKYKKYKENSDLRYFLVIVAILGAPIWLSILYSIIEDYISYICIGLGIAIGLIICYLVYQKFLKKK